jgi:hypothetical protein
LICRFNLNEVKSDCPYALRIKNIEHKKVRSNLEVLVVIIALSIFFMGALAAIVVSPLVWFGAACAAAGVAALPLCFGKKMYVECVTLEKVKDAGGKAPAELANAYEDGAPLDPISLDPLTKQTTITLGTYQFSIHTLLRAMLEKRAERGQLPHPIENRFLTEVEQKAFLKAMGLFFLIKNEATILDWWHDAATTLEERAMIYDQLCEGRIDQERLSYNRAHYGQDWTTRFINHRINLLLDRGIMLVQITAEFDQKEKDFIRSKRFTRFFASLVLSKDKAQDLLEMPDVALSTGVQVDWLRKCSQASGNDRNCPAARDLLDPQQRILEDVAHLGGVFFVVPGFGAHGAPLPGNAQEQFLRRVFQGAV